MRGIGPMGQAATDRGEDGTIERDWNALLLSEYRPRPMLRLPAHRVERAAVPAIDIHNHLGQNVDAHSELHVVDVGDWRVADVPALLDLMDECNVEAIINLDGDWGEVLEANLDRYDRAHPGRFATFCRLDWSDCAARGWETRLAVSLRDSAARGAAGLKVWKDVGLRVRDERDELVFCDDPRLDPMWEVATETHLPVLIHVADPPAHFQPISEHNERLEQLIAHPDWHFYGPGFPTFDELIERLEHLVAAHPNITFIGAHVGCWVQDLGWVGAMLDRYPNFNIDIAARIAELGRQPRAARRLLLAHQTRVLFGTDAYPPSKRAFSLYFRFLETDDEYFPHWHSEPPRAGRWHISGVDLPEDVLGAVYAGNARRLVPALQAPGRTGGEV